MTGQVFVSYSRADRAYVAQLADYLTASGIGVWYDFSLVAGDRFARTIEDEIRSCSVFIVVITPESMSSEWVHREIGYALHSGKVVLPLLLKASDENILLTGLHREDVIGGRMPGAAFMRRLRELTPVVEKTAAALAGDQAMDGTHLSDLYVSDADVGEPISPVPVSPVPVSPVPVSPARNMGGSTTSAAPAMGLRALWPKAVVDLFALNPLYRPFRHLRPAVVVIFPLVAAVAVVVTAVLTDTFGTWADLQPVHDLRRSLGLTDAPTLPETFPFLRDVASWLLFALFSAMLVLTVQQWQLVANCLPDLDQAGVLRPREWARGGYSLRLLGVSQAFRRTEVDLDRYVEAVMHRARVWRIFVQIGVSIGAVVTGFNVYWAATTASVSPSRRSATATPQTGYSIERRMRILS